jgi:hypothetical protein
VFSGQWDDTGEDRLKHPSQSARLEGWGVPGEGRG